MVVPVSDGQSLPGPPLAYNSDLERLEIELLLEGVFRHYGFDFRSYAYASIRRRLWKRVEGEGLRNISALLLQLLQDGSLNLDPADEIAGPVTITHGGEIRSDAVKKLLQPAEAKA